MVKIKVNDVEYSVPSSWDEVTIAQQIEISKVVDRDEQFRNLHMISTYTGVPLDLVRRMNINQFKSVVEIMTFLSKPIPNKIIKSFTHNGNEYFIADSLLRGETQDFLSVEGLLKKYKNNQTEALPYIVAIIAKKSGETLDNYDPWARGIEFMTLPYSTVHSIWFFFAQTEKVLSLNTKQFLEIQDKVLEASLSYSESIVKQSDGQGLYRKLLKTYLLWYIKSIRKSYRNFSIGIPLESSNKNLTVKSKKSRLSNLVKKVKDKFK